MTEEEIREQKLQIYQQYGITEAQIDAFVAVFNKLWEAAKELADNIKAELQELAEGLRKTLQQTDLSALYELVEEIRAAYKREAQRLPPSYYLENARQYNAMQRQRLKSYKNRIGSAAIRRPKRIARSCC